MAQCSVKRNHKQRESLSFLKGNFPEDVLIELITIHCSLCGNSGMYTFTVSPTTTDEVTMQALLSCCSE